MSFERTAINKRTIYIINIMKKIFLAIIGLCFGTGFAYGQVIDTARFKFNFTPKLSNVQKINQQADVTDTVKEIVKFDYYITPQQVDVTFTPSQLKAAKLSPEDAVRYDRNFIKAGFGWPVTPLLEFVAHNANDSKYSYGANIHHFSSWAGPVGKTQKQYAYAPTSDTRVNLFLTRFFKNQTLYSSLGYNHELANLHGYNRTLMNMLYGEETAAGFYDRGYRDTIRNDFHHLKAEVGIRSNYVLGEKKLKEDVRLNYDLIYTRHKDMENHIGLTSFFAYDARFLKISGSQNYRIDVNFDYYNDKSQFIDSSRSANAFKVEFVPSMRFTIKEYHILVGIGVPVIKDFGKAACPIYPVAELQLGIIPGIMSIYAGVNGEIKYQGLKEMLYENPYLKPQLDSLRFSKNQISIYGGIKGNIVKKLNYHVSAKYSYVKDMAFYMLDTSSMLKNQFDLVYSKASTLNVCGSLNWEVIDHLNLGLTLNYWGYYGLDSTMEHAWYKPSFDVAFNGRYILKEKFVFDLNFKLEFGRWAYSAIDKDGNIFTDEAGNVVYQSTKMKPVLDFSLGFEYRITPRFSAFAAINNVGCQYASKYYNFNNFGINALVGVTYSFGTDAIKINKKSK